MTKQLKWRLGKLPTSDEVLKLVNDKIITKEEAREILFNEKEELEQDEESLKSEIKFLRELVENLSKGNHTRIIETIREVQKPYYQWDWYRPYQVWCSSVSGGGGVTNAIYSRTGTTGINSALNISLPSQATTSGNTSFKNIQTF